MLCRNHRRVFFAPPNARGGRVIFAYKFYAYAHALQCIYIASRAVGRYILSLQRRRSTTGMVLDELGRLYTVSPGSDS